MSWVQQNALLPPTLQQQTHQYPQQPKPATQLQTNIQQHVSPPQPILQANAAPSINAQPNPNPIAANVSNTGSYLSKLATNNNNNNTHNQHSSMRSQVHSNGGTLHHHQQQQQQPQQHQPGHFGVQQQLAPGAWQQQDYVQSNKMMQSNAATATNNWQQQQAPQQNPTNIYAPQQQQQQQQQPNVTTLNNWQQSVLPTTSATNNASLPQQQQQQQQPQQQHQYPANSITYDNYFVTTQSPQQQQTAPIPPTQYQQSRDTATFYQQPQYKQQQQQQQPVQPATDYFANNNTNKSDGWSDWDWNDNNSNAIGTESELLPLQQQQQQQSQSQQQHSLESQSTNYNNSNVIEDSFGTQSNDNWNWNMGDDVNANVNRNATSVPVTVAVTTTTANVAAVAEKLPTLPPQVPNLNNRQAPQVPRQVANSVQVPQPKVADFALTDGSGVKPTNILGKTNTTTLPISEASNENYNVSAPNAVALTTPATVATGSTSTATNIPSSVYVSQAKPVSRPSRQYASPPGVPSPTSEPLENALTPPQAFQNDISAPKSDTTAAIPAALPAAVANVSPLLQSPPPIANTPSSNLLPPPLAGVSGVGNPFKRAGSVQHHRAGLLATSTTASIVTPPSTVAPTSAQISAVAIATAFAVPPPPADFANPLLNHMEPDNSEVLHENQEVLGMVISGLPLPPPTSQAITLPGATPIAPLTVHAPPPNDERNQYLQTSHLSENLDEELNLEADSLPPPGLSRLVLGQPELMEASQRMVTGTEEPVHMHIDERQADGEDTSLEPVPSVTLLNGVQRGALSNNGNLGVPSNSSNSSNNTIDITTDRNLYLVPGESNAGNDQRVVTGVETVPDTNAPMLPPQIASGQREIELDGENLEDQQHQFQQQSQHPTILMVSSRDEPPLEGAAAGTELIAPAHLTTESEDHHHHHQTKTKDLSNASTGNDESDPVLDHPHHHPVTRFIGANKSRKHSIGELDRKTNERHQTQRRDKQRSSADRYESEDLDLEESDPYSSDRERERERERRRGYREGSVRSDRERDEREYTKDKRRRGVEKRDDRVVGERDQLRDKYYAREGGSNKSDTLRRGARHNRQYDEGMDDVASRRKEPPRRSGARHHNDDRSERDYDDYNRRYRGSTKRTDKGIDESSDAREVRRNAYADDERRDHRRTRRERGHDYDTMDRRRRTGGASAAAVGDKHARSERVDAREYEEYRKQSSRNARESDLEKERTRYDPRHAAMYGYPTAAYGYDPYASYYYEQMARTNPQAYSEWYKKYYGHAATTAANVSAHVAASGDHMSLNSSSLAAATADGRESVHSGRSSAHNDKERSGHMSVRDADAIAEPDPQRLTPRKFVNEHTIVSLSAGILVTVKPKYTSHGAVSNIVKLQRLGVNDATRQLFHAFPGPLVRGLTHKKTIIEFCEEQIRLGPMETTIYAKQLLSNNIEKYRASYTLMWNLLILLLRQNGMVVGTDIAELLLKNQQQFPYKTQTIDGICSELSGDEEQAENMHAAETVADPDKHEESTENEPTVIAVKSATKSTTTLCKALALTETEITEKFRNFLLYGNVNEALDWATDNNLWGHALFLASKVDRRSHANVMMKFANKLSLNDPLQTLYQLMSGRQPSSVTSVQDEKWGDWRPHLSMILSNTTQKPELDRKSITTLGDSLFNRGDLFAAHFCYLMAQVGFGRYQESATTESTLQQHLPKLVLLGSSHYKIFNDFATNESIMMTEIYEYACSLNDEKFSLVEFQPYKYLLATRLIDYGYHLRSLMYFEQIALHIQRDPSKYEPGFISKIYEFADRLKHYDPVLERSIDEQQSNTDGNSNMPLQNFEEQKWLQDLRAMTMQHKIPDTITSAVSCDQIGQGQNQIDQQFVELNKQFNELNMQYNSNAEPVTLYNADTMQQQQQPHTTDVNTEQHNQQRQSTATTDGSSEKAAALDQKVGQLADTATQKPVDVNDAYAYYNQQQQYLQPERQQEQHSIPYYDPTVQQQQQQQQYHAYGAVGAEPVNVQGNTGAYDYWAQQQQQQQQEQTLYGDENARPSISLPKSKRYDLDDDKQQQQSQQKGGANELKKGGGKHGNSKDANKVAQQGNQNSGWFGGIWNKLSLKPKNQMILPDDKNPSIVWDSEQKRWVNMDGDEAAEESFKPPPKMGDIMAQVPPIGASMQSQPPLQAHIQHTQQEQLQQSQQQQMQQQHNHSNSPLLDIQQYVAAAPTAASPAPAPVPASSPASISGYSAHALTNANNTIGASKTPSLQSNMFKMQRNRTLKNSYVDVFNPSGAPMSKAAENVMAPTVPPAAVPQGGFFIPGPAAHMPAAVDNNDAGAFQQHQQQQQHQHQQMLQQDVPQFYNPNQFGGGGY